MCLPFGIKAGNVARCTILVSEGVRIAVARNTLRTVKAREVVLTQHDSDSDDAAVNAIPTDSADSEHPCESMHGFELATSWQDELMRVYQNKKRNAQARILDFFRMHSRSGEPVVSAHQQEINWPQTLATQCAIVNLAREGWSAQEVGVALVAGLCHQDSTHTIVQELSEDLEDSIRDGSYSGDAASNARQLIDRLKVSLDKLSGLSLATDPTMEFMLAAMVVWSPERHADRTSDSMDAAASLHVNPLYIAHTICVCAAIVCCRGKNKHLYVDGGSTFERRMSLPAYHATLPVISGLVLRLMARGKLPWQLMKTKLMGWFAAKASRHEGQSQSTPRALPAMAGRKRPHDGEELVCWATEAGDIVARDASLASQARAAAAAQASRSQMSGPRTRSRAGANEAI